MRAPGHDAVTLITGFPGFAARQLVTRLAEQPDAGPMRLLVPATDASEAEAHLAVLDPSVRDRIELVEGDPWHIDLGLSGSSFKALAADTQRIFHFAQASDPGVDRVVAERGNVAATREAVEFALACRSLRSFVHLSTTFVSGNRTGWVREDELSAGQRFRNVFEETKARAEKMLSAQRERLPLVVVRAPMLVGDAETGEVDRLDGPYLMVLLILSSPSEVALPMPVRGEALLHTAPVDFVARAALALGHDDRARGRTFHLVDERPPTAREAFELVAKAGGRRGPRGFIPANVTRALLHTPGLARLARSPRAFVEQLTTDVRYDDANARALLDPLGLRCPPFSSYVDAMVAHVRRRVQERREQRRPGRLADEGAHEADIDDPLS